jgi:hypothetical protein
MREQPSLTETLCDALAALREALAEVPYAVTTDVKRGAAILQSCSRLGLVLHTLAKLDMPVANALSDVQAALAAIGEQLQYDDADPAAEEEEDNASERMTKSQFLTRLSTLLARVAAECDVEARMRNLGRGVLHAVQVDLVQHGGHG